MLMKNIDFKFIIGRLRVHIRIRNTYFYMHINSCYEPCKRNLASGKSLMKWFIQRGSHISVYIHDNSP